MMIEQTLGYELINRWMQSRNMKPFDFQKSAWEAISANQFGIINAPTGCGKTYSVFMGTLIRYINQHPEDYSKQNNIGLQLLWITPLRALATDIAKAMQEAVEHIGLPWRIGIRNGDTNSQERIRQKKQIPEILIITPESLHLLLAQKNYPDFFSTLSVIAIDEWHELISSKRGVQIELALSRLKSINH